MAEVMAKMKPATVVTAVTVMARTVVMTMARLAGVVTVVMVTAQVMRVATAVVVAVALAVVVMTVKVAMALEMVIEKPVAAAVASVCSERTPCRRITQPYRTASTAPRSRTQGRR